MRRLLLGFVMLTLPDGSPLYLNSSEIIAFHKATVCSPGARTQIKVHEGVYCVRETVEQVREALE